MSPLHTLPRAFDAVVNEHPDAIALVDTARPGVPRVTFAELHHLVGNAASMLVDRLGMRHGDVLCSWLPNVTEAVALQFAAAQLGVLTVNLNTRYRSSELAHTLRTANAAALALPTGFLAIDFVDLARGVLGASNAEGWKQDWPALRGVVSVDISTDAKGGSDASTVSALTVIDWKSAIAGYDGATNQPECAARPEDALVAFNTSGTTGMPKLAVHTHRAIALHSSNVRRALDLRPDDRLLAALPLCGAFGFTGIMAALLAGAGLVLQPVFDASQAVKWFREEHITHAYGPDNLLGALIDATPRPADLASWRAAAFANFSGDGTRVAERIEREFSVPACGVYGASELLALVSVWPPESDNAVRHQGGGQPVSPEIQVRAANPIDGTVLGHEEDGELQFRGYPVMSGYCGDEEATRAAFTPDGWLRSGDLGRTRTDGSFVYVSRLGDSLRLGGFLVDPAEVETILLDHPHIRAAAVVGIEQPGRGDLAVAFVEGDAELDTDGLFQWLGSRTARFKVPASIMRLEDLPRVDGTNGQKIKRNELRSLARNAIEPDQESRKDPRGTSS